MVKKFMVVLMMLLLLNACSAETESTMEYVEDGLLNVASEPYAIVITVPEDVVQETFGDDGSGCYYEAADGSYTIVTEVLDASTVEEGIEAVSGIPADQLEVIALNRLPMTEYHFAWASSSEEGETVSRCALIESEDYYYVLTMTQQTGNNQQELVDSVFSSFSLGVDETV